MKISTTKNHIAASIYTLATRAPCGAKKKETKRQKRTLTEKEKKKWENRENEEKREKDNKDMICGHVKDS